MRHGFQAILAFTLLTTLSHIATAQSEISYSSGLQLRSSELSASGPEARTSGAPFVPFSAPNTHVEFSIRGGTPLAPAWVLGVDEPRVLVAIRARLEGNWAAAPPQGERTAWPIQLDANGEWSQAHPALELHAWYQAISSNGQGGFVFSDLTRGARSTNTTSFLGATSPHQSGEVVVSEFMKDPAQVSDTVGEWVEVINRAAHRINLEGLVISDDGSNGHLIFNDGDGLWFLPRRRLVLGRNMDPSVNGGIEVDYAYSSFILGNGEDQIVLTGPTGRLVDRVEYDNGVLWPDSSGASISLAPGREDSYLNDDAANWCRSSSPVSPTGSDAGSPGTLNDLCP